MPEARPPERTIASQLQFVPQSVPEQHPTMNPTWRQHGACRGLDPEIFYPVTDEEAEVAKAVCGGCAVREACLEHALGSREREGVWGGCTEKERRRIIRQRRRSA